MTVTFLGRLSIPAVLQSLRDRDVRSLMVEGGAAIIASFFSACVVDTLIITTAPTLVGDNGLGYTLSGPHQVRSFLYLSLHPYPFKSNLRWHTLNYWEKTPLRLGSLDKYIVHISSYYLTLPTTSCHHRTREQNPLVVLQALRSSETGYLPKPHHLRCRPKTVH